MTATRDHAAALIAARINATALRLSHTHASVDEAVSELTRAATEHDTERHGRRSAERTRLRLDLLRLSIWTGAIRGPLRARGRTAP